MPQGSGFDALQHHRKRTRKAEQTANGYENERDTALRLLALAARTMSALLYAFTGHHEDPAELLRILDRERPEPSIGELRRLLRETDPDRLTIDETAA